MVDHAARHGFKLGVHVTSPLHSRRHGEQRVSGRLNDDEHTSVTTPAYVPSREVTPVDEIGHYLVTVKGGEPGRSGIVLRLERRSKSEVQRSEAIARDLDRASQYVRALLPAPRWWSGADPRPQGGHRASLRAHSRREKPAHRDHRERR